MPNGEEEARERAPGSGGTGLENGSVPAHRARVYVATTEGPVLIQRLVAEDALAEGEPSAVCLNGTTTRLPITGAYTYFVRDHVRGFAGRTAFRLDLDRRIDGGSSWMLGVWIAHVLLADGRLAMRGEGADATVFASGEVAFGTGAERRTEVRAVGHVAEKIGRLAERVEAEAGEAGRRLLLLVPRANLPEARNAFARLPAALRARAEFHPVGDTGEVRALFAREAEAPALAAPASAGAGDGPPPAGCAAGHDARLPAERSSQHGWRPDGSARARPVVARPGLAALEGGGGAGGNARPADAIATEPGRPETGRRRWAAALALGLAFTVFAATVAGGYLAWRSAEREWRGLWSEGRYLELAAALEAFPIPLASEYFRERLRPEGHGSDLALSIAVMARRPADGGSCSGLRFRGGATVTVPVSATEGTYRLDRPRALCGFVIRAAAASASTSASGAGEGDGGHAWLLLRREAAAGARDSLLPARRLVSGPLDRSPVLLSQDLPLYLQESWTWTLLAVRAPVPSEDVARVLGEGGGSYDPERLESLRGLGVTVVRSRIGLGR